MLVEQWNGSKWSIADHPDPVNALHATLHGVSCPTATMCVAVGDYSTGAAMMSLVEQWNGTTWSIVSSPNVGAFGTFLYGVSCASTTTCVAVGSGSGDDEQTLAEHWNGGSWVVEPTPNPTSPDSLNGVSCPTTTTCIAAGLHGFESWNGTSWSMMPDPSPVGFAAVDCRSATDCITVGGESVREWDGTNWNAVSIPGTAAAGNLNAVACSSSTSCAAVGWLGDTDSTAPLTYRRDGAAWSVSDPLAADVTFDCDLRSQANGRYVAMGAGAVLRARATSLEARERYECIALGSGHWAIKSLANNRYVSADAGAALAANSRRIGPKQTFTLSWVGRCSCVALAAHDGRLVVADLGGTGASYGVLRAGATAITRAAQFVVEAG
jgi:hypothetical protein